jgi:DNA-binding MarR family transcriptional regulator
MQSIVRRSPKATSARDCASAVMETTLLVMRIIRRETRRRRPAGLSVTELRGLACVDAFPGTSVSEVSDYLGLTLAATSRLIASLVRRQMVRRRVAVGDRRRSALALTPLGRSSLMTARRHTQRFLSGLLSELGAHDLAEVTRAMRHVRPLVTPARRHGA